MIPVEYFLGFDIGGTKVAICLAAKEHGQTKILQSERLLGATQEKFSDVEDLLISTAHKLLTQEKITPNQLKAIGVCAPAPLDFDNGIIYASANMPLWNNIPICDLLSKAFDTPTHLQNDANAAILAEVFFGGAKDCADTLYLSMSTGIGGGIIASGKLVDGPLGNAGEFGHMVLDASGPLCGCGLKGCFEAYCGGLNTERNLRSFLSKKGSSTLKEWEALMDDEKEIKIKTLLTALRLNRSDALEFWDLYTDKLAHACGMLLMSFNPRKMIFGTIALHAGDLFFEPLKRKLPTYAWQACIDSCDFVTSALGKEIAELSGISIALYAQDQNILS